MDYHSLVEWSQRIGLMSILLSLMSFVGLWWASNKIEEDKNKTIGKLKQQASLVADYVGATEHVENVLNPENIDDIKNNKSLLKLSDEFYLKSDQIYAAVKVGDGPISLRGIQLQLINASEESIKVITARWLIGPENQAIEARTSKDGVLVDLSKLECLPKLAKLSLYCPLSKNPSNEGICFDELIKHWCPIRLELVLDNQQFEVIFDESKLRTNFQKLETLIQPPVTSETGSTDKQGAVWKN